MSAAVLLSSSVAAQSEPAVVVDMNDSLEFVPAEVTISVGDTIRWDNPSGVKHTVTADPSIAMESDSVRLPDGAAPFDSGPVATGESWSYTFTVPGRYVYFCIPHELQGMIGTVIVEESGAGAATPATGKSETDRSASEASGAGSPSESSTEADAKSGSKFVFGGHQAPRHEEVREAEGFVKFVYWFGNLHPPAVSLPIGLMIGAALSELLLIFTGNLFFAGATRFCVWTGGATAVVAGVFGWLLAGFRVTDGAWLLTTHRWLGTSAVLLALLVIGLVERAERSHDGGRTGLRFALFSTAGIIMAAGFFGGAMIYGLDHYSFS